MQEYRIDPRFRAEPHGNHIDINQLYGYREQLRAIRYLAPAIAEQRQDLLDRIDALLSSLDDPMRVVVAGGFNAGKSTFLNALVKRQVMPVKAIRSTCTVNTLQAGDRAELIVVRGNGRRDIGTYHSDAHVREQIDVLMKHEHASIARIEVCCPDHPFLERFTLIDTPGLDHNAQDSATSAAEVERADALIWVLHNKGAEKLDHEQILRFRAANPDSPVIAILNQIDCLEEDERNDALATVKIKLGPHVTAILPLSAKLADEGQRDRDLVKLDESRIGELRDYLHLHLFNQYRDLQEKIRFNHRSQGLLADLHQFVSKLDTCKRELTDAIDHWLSFYEAAFNDLITDSASIIDDQFQQKADALPDKISRAIAAEASGDPAVLVSQIGKTYNDHLLEILNVSSKLAYWSLCAMIKECDNKIYQFFRDKSSAIYIISEKNAYASGIISRHSNYESMHFDASFSIDLTGYLELPTVTLLSIIIKKIIEHRVISDLISGPISEPIFGTLLAVFATSPWLIKSINGTANRNEEKRLELVVKIATQLEMAFNKRVLINGIPKPSIRETLCKIMIDDIRGKVELINCQRRKELKALIDDLGMET